MKKIFFVITVLLILVSCGNTDYPSKDIYIGCIGIERDEKLKINCLIPNSSKKENSEDFIIRKASGNNLNEALNNLELGESHKINYNHISSILININSLNDVLFDEILELSINKLRISFNSYIFITKEKIEDIYKIINKESDVLLNPLMEPVYSYDIYENVEPIHLITFFKHYLNDNELILPLIKIKDSSIIINEGINIKYPF